MNIDKGIELRKKGKLIESNSFFIELAKKYPKDAIVQYQCAWSFDVLEKETEAIDYYEKAIELGLPDNDLKEAILGLGSTYRSIGEYEKSKQTFEKGISLFNDNSLKVFYAMTLYNNGELSKSMDILLNIIADTTNDETILAYKKAIKFYSGKLDEVNITRNMRLLLRLHTNCL